MKLHTEINNDKHDTTITKSDSDGDKKILNPRLKDAKYIKTRNRFIVFNFGVIFFTTMLGILSYHVPKSKTIQIKSKFIMNNILPMCYFVIFSILFGGIFLIGVEQMRGFLGYFFKDKLLDLGIIASYFGIISIIVALFLRQIIENIIGFKIKSSPIYDLSGFVIGRIILLIIIYIIEMPRMAKLNK